MLEQVEGPLDRVRRRSAWKARIPRGWLNYECARLHVFYYACAPAGFCR
jgi:hypothetical protein